MIVPDLLHEMELGVWKSLFIHLLRMLEYLGEGKVHELDRRSVFEIYNTTSHARSDLVQISCNPFFRP